MTISPAGGSPSTLSVPSLSDRWDVRDRSYVVRGAVGETTAVVSGISIDRLLDQAGVDPFGFDSFSVSGGGRTVTLTRDQLTKTDAYPDGARPVFYVDAAGALRFLRPSTGPGDLNGDEEIVLPDGAITLALNKGGELGVEMTASKTKIKVGQKITFTATVSGADDGEEVVVNWTFGDGGRATGNRVTHTFERDGNYKVVVGATSADDRTGGSDFERIQVGKPASAKGPDREGGGTNTAAGAPDTGAATGASGPSFTPSAPTPATPTPPAPVPAPVPEPPQPEPVPVRPAEPILPPDQQKAVQEAVPGGAPEQVEGVLLSDASAAPSAAAAEAIKAARTGTPKDEESSASGFASVPPAAVGSLGVLALLGLGAWFERRGLPRRAD